MATLDWPLRVAAVVAVCWAVLWGLWLLAAGSRVKQAGNWFLRNHRLAVGLLVCLSAVLSFSYVKWILGGGPRIIDAAAYFLQARTFSEGLLTIPSHHAHWSLAGRFLVLDPTHTRLAVIFPPGYAAVLALGFLIGHPMWVGPCLGGALVVATAALARRITDRAGAVLAAAGLSTICMALRYHTADTMSHGLAALLVTTTLWCLTYRTRGALLSGGIALGMLLATRPFTALALGAAITVGGFCQLRAREALCRGCLIALGLVPGLWFLLFYQHAATGSWLGSAQLAYYRVTDGPPGCFRYGFGSGIGCMYEHGSYVLRRLPEHFGLLQAATVTGLRLRWHALDLLNLEILAPLLLPAMVSAWREATRRVVLLAILAVILAYVPFYFDGSYPGGGARFYADVLPLEHVLLAAWMSEHRWKLWVFPFSLLGFGIHGVHYHQALKSRDGGRPMFEPKVLEQAGVTRGLVFVGTDHGFFLGHDPKHFDPNQGIVVVRRRGDDTDRDLYHRTQRPPTYRYDFDPRAALAQPGLGVLAFEVPGQDSSRDSPFVPAPTRLYEAESLWPPWRVRAGWMRPQYPPNDCTSGRRALALLPTDGKFDASLLLPELPRGRYLTKWLWVGGAEGWAKVKIQAWGHLFHFEGPLAKHRCVSYQSPSIEGPKPVSTLQIESSGALVSFDALEISRLEP